MQPLARLFLLLGALALVAIIVIGLATGLVLVLSIVGPLFGLGFLAHRWRLAKRLWESRGRLPIAGGVRVLPAGRVRVVALLQIAGGLGGLGVGLSPALFVWAGGDGWLAALVGGFVLTTLAGLWASQVMSGARSVDVLSDR